MSIKTAWHELFSRRSRSEPVSEADLARWFGGEDNWAGVDVTRHTALGLDAVWACVRLISGSIASLPAFVYRRLANGGKERAVDHPLYSLLHDQPNPEQDAFMWREQAMGHLLLNGNHYSQIQTAGSGYPSALWPLDPERMTVTREGAEKVYLYATTDGATVRMRPEQVFHIPGLSYDGLKGYAPLEVAANLFASAIATERYGAEFYKNSGQPGGWIEMPNHLRDKDAIERLKASWDAAHSAWGNKHRVGVLEDGATFKTAAIPPNSAQFIETSGAKLGQIARWFSVPPHMIGDTERSTSWGTGIEQQSIGFVVYTLRTWLVRWEQAILRQLFPVRDRKLYFAEFLVDGLLRGDLTSRMNAYRVGREMGLFTINDLLELENRNPVPEGDRRVMPANWVVLDADGAPPSPEPAVPQEGPPNA